MRKTTTEKVFFCRQVYKWNAKWLRSTSMKVKRTKQTLISKTRFKAISFQWPSKTKQVALTDSMIIANTRYSISYLKIIVSIPNELFWNFKNFCLKLKYFFFVGEQFRNIRKFSLCIKNKTWIQKLVSFWVSKLGKKNQLGHLRYQKTLVLTFKKMSSLTHFS
jgi:hypothetical protein